MDKNISLKELFELVVLEESAQYGVGKTHDKLFKDILNNEQEFVEVVNKFIIKNRKLKKDEVIKIKNSYVTNTYNSKETDVIYKEKTNDVYYLIEHQSTIDESMPYRMLIYCTSILNDVIEKDKLKTKQYRIPTIIPIVLYTGEKKWNVPTKLTDKQIKTEINETILELKYILIDIHDMEEEELLKINSTFAYAMLIEKNKGKDNLIRILKKIAKICDNEEKMLKMKGIIKYLLEPIIGTKTTKEILKRFEKKGGEPVMTAVDYLIADIEKEKREAREEARREARKEAIDEANTRIVKNMKNKGMEIKTISEMTELSEAEIKRIIV